MKEKIKHEWQKNKHQYGLVVLMALGGLSICCSLI